MSRFTVFMLGVLGLLMLVGCILKSCRPILGCFQVV